MYKIKKTHEYIVLLSLAFPASFMTGCSHNSPPAVSIAPASLPSAALPTFADKCQGDFSKLSSKDQKTVHDMTNGKGVEAMRYLYASGSRK